MERMKSAGYVAQAGLRCPACHGKVEKTLYDLDVGIASVYSTRICNECGDIWQEEFRLVGLNEISADKKRHVMLDVMINSTVNLPELVNIDENSIMDSLEAVNNEFLSELADAEIDPDLMKEAMEKLFPETTDKDIEIADLFYKDDNDVEEEDLEY